MASTLLASTAIMLSSLIAILMTGGSKGRSIGFHVHGEKSSELFLSSMSFHIGMFYGGVFVQRAVHQ
ncbi:hypothetical protein HAX54_038533, partial [Datura stramonium]|nr:hypothetical protein [Datura stramonium]